MLGLGWLGLLAALIWGLSWLRSWWLRVKKVVDAIQGPRAFPILGNVHQFKVGAEDFFEQACGTTLMFDRPRILRIWMTVLPYVMVYGAEEAEAVLSSTRHLNKAREYAFIEPWLGRGLLTAAQPLWRPRRKLLTPTFHYDILKSYVAVYVTQAQTLLQKLVEASTEAGKEAVDALPLITRAALDIICETAMGKEIGAQSSPQSPYVQAVYTINEIIQERQKKPWLWPDFAFRLLGRGKEHGEALGILHEFTQSVITHRLAERKKSSEWKGGQRLAFLDLLLEMVEEEKLPLHDVRPEVDTFMFEGHDTTSAGMAWALHLLANDPEAQRRAQEEIDEVLGEEDSTTLTYDHLKELSFLEAVIKESLRLFPSVPIIGRSLDEECVIGGQTVPAGTQVLILPYAVHRDPQHWPQPELFRPQRFLSEESKGRHPYAYLPFSAGPRNCIGQRFALMEEKVVLATLLRHFSFTSPHSRHQVRPTAKLILRPTHGLHLHLQLRRPIPSSQATNHVFTTNAA